MHEEILSDEQIKILPTLKGFSGKFGLVGGTAIALYLGHRRSIDFDLFSQEEFNNDNIKNTLREGFNNLSVLVDYKGELTLVINGVKVTFYKFPFKIAFTKDISGIIKTPDLLTLAAMKSLALGGRGKWKDYIDLYFIFQKYSLSEVIEKAKDLFSEQFNSKLIREQLAYFKDIDYSEKIDYLPGFQVDDQLVKDKLTEISLEK
ncbi:nucleotidyl transferase AbiEii/AbiGii toxin family protein [Candidatus Dojkabacteria bacterium]|nr:nucleotidyl transferase AbiEii/AbiGii toxin family protein [Candidatus Dojkabacteria bacterium]